MNEALVSLLQFNTDFKESLETTLIKLINYSKIEVAFDVNVTLKLWGVNDLVTCEE